MEQSILKTTKKVLGLADDYTPFDLDVTTHINSAFSILTQLGVGPSEGFMIDDDTKLWDDYEVPDEQKNLVKSYIYLKVRILFDPPATSFHITASENQITEFEWRLNNMREVVRAVNLPGPIVTEFENSEVADPGTVVLQPPINAAVIPYNDGSSHMHITWDPTPNVQFVLIWFKVVGDPDFDVMGWGIDQLSVIQDAEVGVDYEYYFQSTADGFDPATSDHFFVTGV